MNLRAKRAASTLMEVHLGEDYATGYIGEDAVFTRTYPNERIERQLGKIAGRYNMHDEMVEALRNSNLELSSALEHVTGTTGRTMIHLRMDANARIIAKALEA